MYTYEGYAYVDIKVSIFTHKSMPFVTQLSSYPMRGHGVYTHEGYAYVDIKVSNFTNKSIPFVTPLSSYPIRSHKVYTYEGYAYVDIKESTFISDMYTLCDSIVLISYKNVYKDKV